MGGAELWTELAVLVQFRFEHIRTDIIHNKLNDLKFVSVLAMLSVIVAIKGTNGVSIDNT